MGFKTRMQNLATKLVETTFVDVSGTLVLNQLGEWNQATQSAAISATDTKVAIRNFYTKNEVDGDSIQTGDYRIIVARSGMTVNPKADNVSATFNGVAFNIESVDEDPALARYIIQGREL